jgi:hypothetical protein
MLSLPIGCMKFLFSKSVCHHFLPNFGDYGVRSLLPEFSKKKKKKTASDWPDIIILAQVVAFT